LTAFSNNQKALTESWQNPSTREHLPGSLGRGISRFSPRLSAVAPIAWQGPARYALSWRTASKRRGTERRRRKLVSIASTARNRLPDEQAAWREHANRAPPSAAAPFDQGAARSALPATIAPAAAARRNFDFAR